MMEAGVTTAQPLLRSSLRERIKDVMLQRIVAGRVRAGRRGWSRRGSRRSCGVSQASVREALRDLEHIGCVVYEPYRGCSRAQLLARRAARGVPRPGGAGVARGAARAPSAMTDAELRELDALYDAMLAAARAGDAHEQSQADAAFHAAIARGARNATLERQWSFLEPYSRTFVTVSRPGHRPRRASPSSTCRCSTRSRPATASAPPRRWTST